MRKFLFILKLSITGHFSNAQGFVAIRSNDATCTMTGAHNDDSLINQSNWTFFGRAKPYAECAG